MAGRLFVLIFATVMFLETSCAKQIRHLCSSSCGNLNNITFPFRLTTDPSSCGDARYSLSCENNRTVLYLPVYLRSTRSDPHRYYVEAINYNNYTIRLVDPGIRKGDFSSIPSLGLSAMDVSQSLSNYYRPDLMYELEISTRLIYSTQSGYGIFKNTHYLSKTLVFFDCEKPVQNSSYIKIDDSSFVFNHSSSATTPFLRSQRQSSYKYCFVFDVKFSLNEIEDSCRLDQIALVTNGANDRINNSYDVHNALVYGFELSWLRSFAGGEEHICYLDEKDSKRVRCVSSCIFPHGDVVLDRCDRFSRILGYLTLFLFHMDAYKYFVGFLASRGTIGILLIAFVILKWCQRRHSSIYDGIEEFLKSHNNLVPIRYSYGEIKSMTKGFKEKLGEGGFGCVYKGKLRSGRLVAIKMLGNSKTSGQDFINEVATIGRIHHVNVVRLIGFFVKGSKRALVYDFMPNGSLDKFIFSREETQNSSINSKKILDISIGIARGIEYLHRGCDMQILHFDIKPHNILLDENFIPKVSDFGLARLCPLDKSMVSLTAARGTMGYIAPELFYKNIGGVSHKADVYSFGMLLMEMANRRRNVKADAERTSQVYFPLWIYNQLSQGHDMEMENATEAESKAIKKMVIVALWCIQLKPCDRPSMNKVIEMLEGEVESLEMPPKLYLYPQEENNAVNHEAEDAMEMSNATNCLSVQSNEEFPEISLISNVD